MMDPLVTTEWLAAAMGADDLIVADATFYPRLPGSPTGDPRAEYDAVHIPGAVFLDVAALADADNPLPSMLPSADRFEQAVAALGIGDATQVVLYDRAPHHTSARAWWMFRAFGKHEVAILDGGFAKWIREGRPVAAGDERPHPRRFTARPDQQVVRSLADVVANLTTGDEQVVDARSAARFTGDEPDPHAGVASGHIPGSRNLPYRRLVDTDGLWKAAPALRAEFAAAGVALERPLVTTCGSGITAAVVAFAAHLLGADVALYDGSWSEWGSDPATPKATGPA